MVIIRLSRQGAKKEPHYNIVVADKRSPRDGRFIERLGYFKPLARGKDTSLCIDKKRVEYWRTQGGAHVSNRVSNLLKSFAKQDIKNLKTNPIRSQQNSSRETLPPKKPAIEKESSPTTKESKNVSE